MPATSGSIGTIATFGHDGPALAPAGVPRRVPLHPGRFLDRHYLQPLALTQTEAARRLGVSRRRVNELVQGRRAMTPDTAIRCAQLFGLPAADWLAMQSEWDSYAAWQHLRQASRAASTGGSGGAGRSGGHDVR